MSETSSTTDLWRTHFEISTLISGFFRLLDERKFEQGWAGAFFTDDLRTTTPVGTAEGADAVRLVEEALGRFKATLHLSSDVIVRSGPDDRTADASWNAHMTHVHLDSTLRARGEGADPLFTVGGVWEGSFRRTDSGWRMSRTLVRPVWTTGEPPDLAARVSAAAR
ncbi:nuclear transport factor 2 family protein [Streptomyces bauhiniae]|uniref:nuclear transport factor 2 family protein n=1 Tax=Streptomyces bauhiniae TaxID=2340725 RepID=UPI00333432A9